MWNRAESPAGQRTLVARPEMHRRVALWVDGEGYALAVETEVGETGWWGLSREALLALVVPLCGGMPGEGELRWLRGGA